MDGAFGYWFLQIVLSILWIVELLTDLLFGYTFRGGTKQERKDAHRSYAKSAQLVKILCKAGYHEILDLSDLSYYLYKHDRYVSPKYVLDKTNVALYFVTKTHAVFAVGEEDEDFYDTKKVPFCFLSYQKLCKKLLITPMSSFHRLASELGDPKVPVSIFGMTARCGSTLMAQILNRVPNTRSMSEPWVWTYAYTMFNRGQIDIEEYRQMIRSCTRLQTKVEPSSNVNRIAIKVNLYTNTEMLIMHEFFPNFQYFFTARMPLPSLISYRKLLNTMDMSLYFLLGICHRKLARFAPFPYLAKYDWIKNKIPRWYITMPFDEMITLYYSSGLCCYLELKHIIKHTILYENLTADPAKEISKLFDMLDIPQEYVPLGLTALEQHSQKGVICVKARNNKISQANKKMMDTYFKELDLPIRTTTTLEEFKEFFGLEQD